MPSSLAVERMFPAFAKRGIEITGVDLSEAMLARAAERMAGAGLPAPRTLRADMASFDLGGVFDGAVCPINTFGYLLQVQFNFDPQVGSLGHTTSA